MMPALAIIAAAFLVGIAIDRRSLVTVLTTTLLCGTALALSGISLHIGTGWIAAAVALSATLNLVHGSAARRLSWAVGPILLLAFLAAYSSFAMRRPVFATIVLLVTSLSSAWVGWRLRKVQQQPWFTELAVLVSLTAIALMAAPTVLLGWQRASIAAEGQDAAAHVESALWPVAVAAIAFLSGVIWRMWMSNRGRR